VERTLQRVGLLRQRLQSDLDSQFHSPESICSCEHIQQKYDPSGIPPTAESHGLPALPFCEPLILKKTGLTIADHQRITIEGFMRWRRSRSLFQRWAWTNRLTCSNTNHPRPTAKAMGSSLFYEDSGENGREISESQKP
jgi:hypothetical protein